MTFYIHTLVCKCKVTFDVLIFRVVFMF